ncbi:tetratricopeptide repeat protein [Nocardiopsis deserti]|uniref:tetratricopeptide repeat protein n=1 Tax=Nocardiopsis deserti TaxID=2605988 RepID=UPI00123B8688|nr:tetratricopeptide repeat protein [Nocardiopsis deserti]
MSDEKKPPPILNWIASEDFETVVQAGTIHGGVHVNSGGADDPSALEDPVIVTVHREGGEWLAVDADPPRRMPVSGMMYIVTLEARTTRAVVLRAARVVVLSRRLPRPAYSPDRNRIGARPSSRYFEAELTLKDRVPLSPFDTDSPQLRPIGPDFPFTISATDIEVFLFRASAGLEEVCWQVELDWICAGRQGTVVINDNGYPFETYPSGVFLGPGSWALEEDWSTYGKGLERRLGQEDRTPPPPQTWSQSTGIQDVYDAALALDADMRDLDPDDPAAWSAYQQLAMYVRTLLGQERFHSHRSEEFRALLIRVIRFFFASGQSELGLRIMGPVHDDWKTNLGEDNPHTLILADRLAGCLYGMGKYGQARDLFESILPGVRKILGAKHPVTITTTINLALALGNLGELDAAEELAGQALRMSTQELGNDHPNTRRALNVVAYLPELRQAKGK